MSGTRSHFIARDFGAVPRCVKRELAAASRSHAVVFWASSVPWIGAVDEGAGWAGCADERREIANFIAQNGIRNLVILSGGAEMLAADDGTNSDY